MSTADGMKRPAGTIKTLLDLTNRDLQENDLFPIGSQATWFARDTEYRTLPFTPLIQEIPFRGPADFGQKFSFDLGSLLVGDFLFGSVLQIRLNHWLDPQTQLLFAAEKVAYMSPGEAWEYANSLGSVIIKEAELEIDGKTIETIDGDFINLYSLLFADYNSQVPVAFDHLGRISTTRLMAQMQPRLYPVEDGILHCLLPFFFMRCKYQDALPMAAIKEGLVRLHITLRPLEECVRQLRGFRDSCTATPLSRQLNMFTVPAMTERPVTTAVAMPDFRQVQLLTYGAITQGKLREGLLYDPFENLYREVQTFYFEEPLKYATSKRAEDDIITVQLPLEPNHPLEEILWFVRRKGVGNNNAWTNYTSVLEEEWNPVVAEKKPLLHSAKVQANGITLCEAEEQYFRQLIASHHRGGAAAYNAFVYGYPFSRTPGEHQPSGSFNASRVNSLRLTLDVRPPGGVLDGAWEVKVFCIGINWMRFENGLANPMFED